MLALGRLASRLAPGAVRTANPMGKLGVENAGLISGAWGWRSLARGAKAEGKKKGGKADEAAGDAPGITLQAPTAESRQIDMSDFTEILADPNPANHRPGDVGKVFMLNANELKQLFPSGIAGAWHLLLFGSRSRLPQQLRRGDDWWSLVLKERPGLVIRKEASHIMSALTVAARVSSKPGRGMETSGFLIEGAPGTGKSAILNHVAHWAMKRGDWIVLWVPHASEMVVGNFMFARSGETGEFITQPSYTIKFLNSFLEMNGGMLADIEIDDDGNKVNIPTAIANLNALTLNPREEKADRLFNTIIEALKAQTKHPVLVAVDEINALQGMSLYMDLDMKLVPAQNINMAKTFSKFMDHGFKRGVVVGASTRQGQFANVRLPKSNKTPLQVRGFTRDEISMYLTYMYKAKDFFTPVSEELLDYLVFTTAGRPLDLEKACSHEIFNLGLRNDSRKMQKTEFYQQGGFDKDLITDPAIPEIP